MSWRAALPLALVGATPAAAPMRVFVEQGVPVGARTEVVMLRADGAYEGLSSTTKKTGSGRAILNTDKGYWYFCGSWRLLPGGGIAVHRQLVESFRFLPPAKPGAWSTTMFTPVPSDPAQRVSAEGRTYALVARPPLEARWASGDSQACAVSRRREPAMAP